MYLIRRYKGAIIACVNTDSRRALWVAAILTLLALVCLSALLSWVGAPIMNGRPGDVPICLDGAWRIANGQVIHRDFYSHLGALPFYLTWVGMKLSQPGVASIMYGNIALMVVLTGASLFVLERRTSGLYTLLLSCFVAVLVVTPRPLGDPYDYVDHAMLYNRFGEAFLILLGILAFLPPRIEANSLVARSLEIALTGLLLCALWFTKISYFAVGVAFIGSAAVLKCLSPGRVLLCVAAAVVFTALFLAMTRIPLSAMLEDMRLALGAQAPGGRAKALIVQAAKQVLPVVVLVMLTAETFCGEHPGASHPLVRFRTWILSGMLFVSSVFLVASNCQAGELPLLSVAGLYCAENIRRQSKHASHAVQATALRSSFACGLVLCLVLPTFGTDLATLRHTTRQAAAREFVSPEILRDTNLGDFRFSPTGTRSLFSQTYFQSVDDGIRLLRRRTQPGMRLGVFIFANPFHLALDLPPAEGGTICWVWSSWAGGAHPPLRRLLGNATHILTDRGCYNLRALYGAEWDSLHAEIIEETEHFTLVALRQEPK